MPRQKQYASATDRLREYRKRQRAEKAAKALPSPEQIIERAEATEKVEQLARAAGVPRNYPLSVWKRAANALIQGEGKSQEKVKALRSLCAVDKEWRKKVSEWVRADQSEASKKYIAAQGWTLADGAKPQSLVDRMVACLEAGKRLEDHFTPEELASPAEPDPIHEELWARYQHYIKTGKLPSEEVIHLCGQCGDPSTRTIEIAGQRHAFCAIHDGTQRPGQYQAPSVPQSPAEYINSDFGKLDPRNPQDNKILTLQALRDAQGALLPVSNRPMVGPVDYEKSVFASRQD